ncbi:hypothetical protein D6D01_03402 [Aureobasidium pullulans]|uniref:Uncharacterized protein n=1 Tax=Aureobasidium pullulans TaxID=5580 RepID=A0A4S9LK10_AURPU|nr:hypothetical protein D6D01_03402 [Aureobasidium pullulans]
MSAGYKMGQTNSEQAPVVGRAHVNNGAPKGRETNPLPPRRMRGRKYYQDFDRVQTRPGSLDYDDEDDGVDGEDGEDLEPASRNDLTGRHKHKKYKSKDGYHLVVHGGADRNAGIKTEPALDQRETFDEARRGKATETQSLPQNRKRAADWDNNHQISSKKQRRWKDRRNRQCMDCGYYHSSPCFVPHCHLCGFRHHNTLPCQDAMMQLRERIASGGAPVSSPSSQEETNVVQSSLSALRAPVPLFRSTSESPIIKKERYEGAGSNNKKGCPFCRECGSFHRSACKWLVCKKCSVKHHPEVPCTDAEARLRRRLEEEESKQAQRFLEEEDRKRAQEMADVRDKLAASTLDPMEMRRSSAPNPGYTFGPSIAPKKSSHKKYTSNNCTPKGTKFCRDCGRYLNRACDWPTCGNLETIACSLADHFLQLRLKKHDRGRGPSASQNKQANIAKKWSHVALGPSPLKQVEQADYTDPTSSAAPLPIAAPILQPASNFPFAGDVSWFVDSNNIIRFGSAPPPPMPQQKSGQVYPLAPKPMEKAVPGIAQSELVSILSRVGSSPYPSAVKSYLEENIDALLEEAEMNARANRAVVVERDDGDNQEPPSYFEWRRRGGRQ